jgi:type I restriction enzyme R subunit
VVFDRECCVLYKAVMNELIDPEASAIVMTGTQTDPKEWKVHVRDKDAEEKLLDRFRDPSDPLQFVIVTSTLLTGFDAPILQVMYLDKPMKDHNLLQAICRTNRTFGQEKTHGLIVDYIGIFDDVARALDFDEKAVERIVADIDEIVKKVRFPDWQHTSQGERLVQKELRRTLLKYKLHTDQELFDKAYGYIRQYY